MLSFVHVTGLQPLKIVINSGISAAGPTFDAIAERLQALGAPLDLGVPSHTRVFSNGIRNPLLSENQTVTVDVVRIESADFSVALDGDFDRCFFFDEKGQFVPGEYIVGLLAELFWKKKQVQRLSTIQE